MASWLMVSPATPITAEMVQAPESKPAAEPPTGKWRTSAAR